eukprot:TRINITY_DN2378_c0_g1_i4.p1 TRINITY_DN2378_c0_g1~~TRINITY_DN2378_c0_g1_i4.p1  ORF type:complete len:104 (-),score=21.75 TRINITY_DN2378_c0_g1_i4:214-525(-)
MPPHAKQCSNTEPLPVVVPQAGMIRFLLLPGVVLPCPPPPVLQHPAFIRAFVLCISSFACEDLNAANSDGSRGTPADRDTSMSQAMLPCPPSLFMEQYLVSVI